jgi:hypothetical protein
MVTIMVKNLMINYPQLNKTSRENLHLKIKLNKAQTQILKDQNLCNPYLRGILKLTLTKYRLQE